MDCRQDSHGITFTWIYAFLRELPQDVRMRLIPRIGGQWEPGWNWGWLKEKGKCYELRDRTKK